MFFITATLFIDFLLLSYRIAWLRKHELCFCEIAGHPQYSWAPLLSLHLPALALSAALTLSHRCPLALQLSLYLATPSLSPNLWFVLHPLQCLVPLTMSLHALRALSPFLGLVSTNTHTHIMVSDGPLGLDNEWIEQKTAASLQQKRQQRPPEIRVITRWYTDQRCNWR